MAPGSTSFWREFVPASMTRRWLGTSGCIGLPVLGSGAALERITGFRSGATARSLPTKGSIADTVFVAVSSTAMPPLVPMKPFVPVALNTSELGVPGRLIAVPATMGDLLVSIGIRVGVVPLGGAKELV